jgi:ribose transport system permease protein
MSTAQDSVTRSGADLASSSIRRLRLRLPLILGIIAVVAMIISAVSTGGFLDVANIKALIQNASLIGIVAASMTPMTLSGNFVSLGTQQTVVAAGMVFVLLVGHGYSSYVAVLITFLAVSATGVFQGFIISLGLNPIIMTLATGSVVYGIVTSVGNNVAMVNVGNRTIWWGNASLWGLPIDIVVMIVFAAVVSVYIQFTTTGRRIVLMGSNRAAAKVAGISYPQITIITFLIFSAGLTLAAVLYGAGFGQVTVDSLSTLTFDVVAALLVGGIALEGGHGSPWRSVLGAIFISTVNDVLALHGIDPGKGYSIEGLIVVVAVIMVVMSERRRRQR